MRNEEVKNRSEEEISKEALCEDVQLEQVNGGMNLVTDPRSIKEELERLGIDGSYQSRKKLYYEMGGSNNYTGTARQDQQILNYLKSRYGY